MRHCGLIDQLNLLVALWNREAAASFMSGLNTFGARHSSVNYIHNIILKLGTHHLLALSFEHAITHT
jgi:hypothetical protein